MFWGKWQTNIHGWESQKESGKYRATMMGKTPDRESKGELTHRKTELSTSNKQTSSKTISANHLRREWTWTERRMKGRPDLGQPQQKTKKVVNLNHERPEARRCVTQTERMSLARNQGRT